MAHRHRRRQQQGAGPVGAGGGGVGARQRAGQFGRTGRGGGGLVVVEHRQLVAAGIAAGDGAIEPLQVVEQPAAGGRQFGRVRVAFIFAGAGAGVLAVGDQPAFGVVKPGAGLGGLDQTPHHAPGEVAVEVEIVATAGHRPLAERAGKDAGLGVQRHQAGVDHAVLIAAEHHGAADQDDQRRQIDRQDLARQRRNPPVVAPALRGLRALCSGNRRHRGFRSG